MNNKADGLPFAPLKEDRIFSSGKEECAMNQSERRLYLIKSLLKEEPSYRRTQIPQGTEKQELLLRGLLNVLPPRPVDEEFLKIQDAYLQEKT